MDSFQLLAFLVDAACALAVGPVSIDLHPKAMQYTVRVRTAVAVDYDLRVALRDLAIKLDEQLRGDSRPMLDGFRLAAAAQRKRREADTWKRKRAENMAADALAEAEALEAEALNGRAR